MSDEPIKKFFPDNLPEYIEKGVPLVEHRLWAHRTEDDGVIRYWLGAEPDVWLRVADILYKAGNEARALADAIAYEFGMSRREDE